MSNLSDPVKQFADSLTAAREAYEVETRQDLLRKMESLFSRWRHHEAQGWDVHASREERTEGFERALDLLAEAHEIIEDMG